MPRFLTRFVAVLLAPCLLGNPGLAMAFAGPTFGNSVAAQAVFGREALAPRLSAMQEPGNSWNPMIRVRVVLIAAALLAASISAHSSLARFHPIRSWAQIQTASPSPDPSTPFISAVADESNPITRWKAAHALTLQGNPQALPLLHELMTCDNGDVRQGVLKDLAALKDWAAIESVLVQDDDFDLRMAALHLLSDEMPMRMETLRAMYAIGQDPGDETPLRIAAIQALGLKLAPMTRSQVIAFLNLSGNEQMVYALTGVLLYGPAEKDLSSAVMDVAVPLTLPLQNSVRAVLSLDPAAYGAYEARQVSSTPEAGLIVLKSNASSVGIEWLKITLELAYGHQGVSDDQRTRLIAAYARAPHGFDAVMTPVLPVQPRQIDARRAFAAAFHFKFLNHLFRHKNRLTGTSTPSAEAHEKTASEALKMYAGIRRAWVENSEMLFLSSAVDKSAVERFFIEQAAIQFTFEQNGRRYIRFYRTSSELGNPWNTGARTDVEVPDTPLSFDQLQTLYLSTLRLPDAASWPESYRMADAALRKFMRGGVSLPSEAGYSKEMVNAYIILHRWDTQKDSAPLTQTGLWYSARQNLLYAAAYPLLDPRLKNKWTTLIDREHPEKAGEDRSVLFSAALSSVLGINHQTNEVATDDEIHLIQMWFKQIGLEDWLAAPPALDAAPPLIGAELAGQKDILLRRLNELAALQTSAAYWTASHDLYALSINQPALFHQTFLEWFQQVNPSLIEPPAVATTLMMLLNRNNLDAFIPMLLDPSTDVRRRRFIASWVVARGAHDSRFADDWVNLLKDPDSTIRGDALQSLVGLRDARILPVLESMLHSKEQANLLMAMGALAQMNDWAPLIQIYLHHEDSGIRRVAFGLFNATNAEQRKTLIPALLEVAQNPKDDIALRTKAMYALDPLLRALPRNEAATFCHLEGLGRIIFLKYGIMLYEQYSSAFYASINSALENLTPPQLDSIGAILNLDPATYLKFYKADTDGQYKGRLIILRSDIKPDELEGKLEHEAGHAAMFRLLSGHAFQKLISVHAEAPQDFGRLISTYAEMGGYANDPDKARAQYSQAAEAFADIFESWISQSDRLFLSSGVDRSAPVRFFIVRVAKTFIFERDGQRWIRFYIPATLLPPAADRNPYIDVPIGTGTPSFDDLVALYVSALPLPKPLVLPKPYRLANQALQGLEGAAPSLQGLNGYTKDVLRVYLSKNGLTGLKINGWLAPSEESADTSDAVRAWTRFIVVFNLTFDSLTPEIRRQWEALVAHEQPVSPPGSPAELFKADWVGILFNNPVLLQHARTTEKEKEFIIGLIKQAGADDLLKPIAQPPVAPPPLVPIDSSIPGSAIHLFMLLFGFMSPRTFRRFFTHESAAPDESALLDSDPQVFGSDGSREFFNVFLHRIQQIYSPGKAIFVAERDEYKDDDVEFPFPRDLKKARLSPDEQKQWDDLIHIFHQVFSFSGVSLSIDEFQSHFRLIESPQNGLVTIASFSRHGKNRQIVFYVNRQLLKNLASLKRSLGKQAILDAKDLSSMDNPGSIDVIHSILFAIAFHEVGHLWGPNVHPDIHPKQPLQITWKTEDDENRLLTFRGGETYNIMNIAAYLLYLRYAGLSSAVQNHAISLLPAETQEKITQLSKLLLHYVPKADLPAVVSESSFIQEPEQKNSLGSRMVPGGRHRRHYLLMLMTAGLSFVGMQAWGQGQWHSLRTHALLTLQSSPPVLTPVSPAPLWLWITAIGFGVGIFIAGWAASALRRSRIKVQIQTNEGRLVFRILPEAEGMGIDTLLKRIFSKRQFKVLNAQYNAGNLAVEIEMMMNDDSLQTSPLKISSIPRGAVVVIEVESRKRAHPKDLTAEAA